MAQPVLQWKWNDRNWCAKCQAHPRRWDNDRCSCCRADWGDPYARSACKKQHLSPAEVTPVEDSVAAAAPPAPDTAVEGDDVGTAEPTPPAPVAPARTPRKKPVRRKTTTPTKKIA